MPGKPLMERLDVYKRQAHYYAVKANAVAIGPDRAFCLTANGVEVRSGKAASFQSFSNGSAMKVQ